MLLRDNNFDLIRLLAAIQVFVMHAVAWLKLSVPPVFMEVVDWFPGVPIFFIISGYLVTASSARSPSTVQFFRNRALRILPGLWACLIVTFFIVALRDGLPESNLLLKTLAWFITNGSIFQFVGDVGTGVVNGALWSISTEAQFYLLIPLVGVFSVFFRGRKAQATAILFVLVCISGLIHQWVLANSSTLHPWIFQVVYPSILANGYFFLMGVLAYIWRDQLIPIVRSRLIVFLGLYIVVRMFLLGAGYTVDVVHSTMLGVAVYLFLGLTIFAAAHTAEGLSRWLLRGHDFSYGLNIYHMPVIYALIHHQLFGAAGMGLATVLVGFCAVVSWFAVEKPALGYKHYSVQQAGGLASYGKPTNEAQ